MKLITLFLTCKDREEADKISDALLAEQLIACAKQTSVSSKFYWQGKADSSDEIMLIMDSTEEKFEAIEGRVKQLHSYDTFVLTATSVIKASKGVEEWVKDAINTLPTDT